jgi:hypothetical protein
MRAIMRSTAVFVSVLSMGAAGCLGAVGPEEIQADEERLGDVDQAYAKAENGLMAVNGLTATNGLRSANGLTVWNGLKTFNGFDTINGLVTRNGFKTVNGSRFVKRRWVAATLHVDCTGRTLNTKGGHCTGDADGLMSSTTGLLRDQDGVDTAHYLVRCALPDGQSIQLKRWDGQLETFYGQVGLAPEWLSDSPVPGGICDKSCQEKVTACLLAHSNGFGIHIGLELSSTQPSIGVGHSSGFPYQEAAFYGNIFLNPPQAYAAMGLDYTTPKHLKWHAGAQRACRGYGGTRQNPMLCPLVLHSFSRCVQTSKDARGNGTATYCTDPRRVVWNHPITTYRAYRTNELEPYYGDVVNPSMYYYTAKVE